MSYTRLPRRVPAALSLAAALAAVLLVADAPVQLEAVVVETAALAVGVAGAGLRARGRPALGWLAAVAGFAVAAGAFALPLSALETPALVLELYSGMVGLLLLALALAPVREGRERGLLVAGAGALLVGVLTSGVLHGAGRLHLLAAGVATVVAWDAGEQAVTLGEHVGAEASALRAEVVHPLLSVGVGAAGVLVALGVSALGVTGLSLAALLALLVVGLLTSMALSR